MKTTTYNGNMTIEDLLTFVCSDFLKEEKVIYPFRLKCAKDIADKCMDGSKKTIGNAETMMLWVNQGPGIREDLKAGTIVYLDDGELG